MKAKDALRGWQPIGTAPKDGSPVLTYDGDMMVVAVWCGCKGEWFLSECEGGRPHAESPIEWVGITHWHPLPEPPTEGREP